MFTRGCLRRNMDIRIHLITLLCIGWITYTHNSGLPLELTQFQSGDDVTLVCTDAYTTFNIEFTFWYMGDVRVLMSVSAGNVCQKHPPNITGDTYAYSYDLYTSTDVSGSCGYLQHNMTLTTTQYLRDDTVWRCEDQRKRVSNNLTLDILGTAYESTPPLSAAATTIPTVRAIHGNKNAIIIMVMAGGGVVILIISVLCVCFVRRRQRRIGKATQDVSLAEVDTPHYDTLAHNGNTDPCYSEIKTEASRQSSIHANDVYYNTVPKNADYENPPMKT